MLNKPKRRRFKDERARVRGKPCLVCGAPSDACHIKSRGAGGGDEPWNLIPLCRSHHILQHRVGWHNMAQHHWAVEIALDDRGWKFETATGLVKLVRK